MTTVTFVHDETTLRNRVRRIVGYRDLRLVAGRESSEQSFTEA